MDPGSTGRWSDVLQSSSRNTSLSWPWSATPTCSGEFQKTKPLDTSNSTSKVLFFLTHLIRWSPEAAFKHLKSKNQDFVMLDYPFERGDNIKRIQKTKLAYVKNADRAGRPMLYAKLKNFLPGSKITDRDYQEFFYYTIEQLYSSIPEDVVASNVILLIDIKDTGYKNLGIQTSMKITNVLFVRYLLTLAIKCRHN